MQNISCGLLLLICSVVRVCVCETRALVVPKRLNRSRCRLECGLGWAKGTMHWLAAGIPQEKEQFWGRMTPGPLWTILQRISGVSLSNSIGGSRVLMRPFAVTTVLTCYARRRGDIERCREPPVSTAPGSAAPLAIGSAAALQATRAVRTADPSAHGRRSAVIGGNISSRRAITWFVCINV